MKRVAFAVPGDLATPTGGYAYDCRVIEGLRAAGWQVDVVDLGGGFPFPDEAQRAEAKHRLTGITQGCPLVVDGLAFGAMAEEAKLLRDRHSLIALVHHPLALESGLSADVADALRESERAALTSVTQVIVTSAQTADILARDYDVPCERIVVARPGCVAAPLARGSDDGIVHLLAVGAVSPRKGYITLIEALSPLYELSWHLTIAGALDRNDDEVVRVETAIRQYGLSGKVTLAGAVKDARLSELYVGADVFVSASLFEGYGMALAQAIAHGLPVVATCTGAASELVPPDAGVLVDVGDGEALQTALRRVVTDAALREQLKHGAQAAREHLPRWMDTAALIAGALERSA